MDAYLDIYNYNLNADYSDCQILLTPGIFHMLGNTLAFTCSVFDKPYTLYFIILCFQFFLSALEVVLGSLYVEAIRITYFVISQPTHGFTASHYTVHLQPMMPINANCL